MLTALRLIWLPWFAAEPPLSPTGRLRLADALTRLQRRQVLSLPGSERRRDLLGDDIYTWRIRDPPIDREITYQLVKGAIVIAEVLPAVPECRDNKYLIVRRLSDYRNRDGLLAGSEWIEGEVSDFLGLTPDQVALVRIRLALGDRVRKIRWDRRWTQEELARALGTSRPRITKMEAGDVSVSLDACVSTLLALGLSRRQLGFTVAGPLKDQKAPAKEG